MGRVGPDPRGREGADLLNLAATKGAARVLLDVPEAHPLGPLQTAAQSHGWESRAEEVNTAEVGEPVSRRRVLWLAGKDLSEGLSLEDLGLRGRVGAPAAPFLQAAGDCPEGSWTTEGRWVGEPRAALGGSSRLLELNAPASFTSLIVQRRRTSN